MTATPMSRNGVTLRSILLGAVLIFPNAYWLTQNERVRQGPYASILALQANVIFVMLGILIFNALVHRLLPRLCFSSTELLVVYAMLAMGTAVGGEDIMHCVMVMLPHGAWFASPENRWGETIMKQVPRLLLVRNRNAVAGFITGASSFYTRAHVAAWIAPLTIWIALLMILTFVTMCICVIFRRRWTEHEHLHFPIIQLPLALAQRPSSLFRSRVMWLGFAAAAFVDIINGLHVYFPAVPNIQIVVNASQFITSKPWNAMGWFWLTFYPIIIGIAFLMPLDLLFSIWFFCLFWRGQKVVASVMGWDGIPDFPFTNEQILGGCVCIALSMLWRSRNYLKEVWQIAWRNKSFDPHGPAWDDREEAMSYRTALVGIAVSLIILIILSRWFGMSWHVAVLFFILFLITSLVVARIRAQLGCPVHDFFGASPSNMIVSLAHADRLPTTDRAMLGMYWSFSSAYQTQPQPYEMEGMQIANRMRMDQRRLMGATLLAAFLGMVAAAWVFLDLGYRLGTASKFYAGIGYGTVGYEQMHQWLTASSHRPGEQGLLASVAGFGFTFLLGLARDRWLGWPFHPIGYLIAGNWSMKLVWLPFIISWMAKSAVLRYGGLALYRRVLPFFLGLILGECVVGCLWSIVGIAFSIPNYNFWGA